MKDFAPDSKTLTIEFDSIEDADNFKTWLCNRGEQYLQEDDFENGSFVDFDYHDPGGSTIIAKRIKRDQLNILKKYAYWRFKNSLEESFFPVTDHDCVPRFANGRPMFLLDEADLIYVIKAETFEEALAVHYLRQGFQPYTPMGEPQQCLSCHNYFYLGSGECFCGFKHDQRILRNYR